MKYIEIHFENFQKEKCDYNKLKKLAKELSDRMYCDRFGSCVHFAEEFVDLVYKTNKDLLDCFDVIEGYVDTPIGYGIPQQHTWIELKNGEKIDPTFIQFTKYGKAFYFKDIKKRYSGREYYEDGANGTWFSKRRKEHPEWFFKK